MLGSVDLVQVGGTTKSAHAHGLAIPAANAAGLSERALLHGKAGVGSERSSKPGDSQTLGFGPRGSTGTLRRGGSAQQSGSASLQAVKLGDGRRRSESAGGPVCGDLLRHLLRGRTGCDGLSEIRRHDRRRENRL